MAVLNQSDGLQHIDQHGGVLEIPPLPSILMSFWAPVLHATDAGLELQALGEAFVG